MVRKLVVHFDGIPSIMKNLYFNAVLPILLYGSETWTLTNRIKSALEGFHNGIAREINRRSFVKIFLKTHRYEDIDWKKMREKKERALGFIKLRTMQEYWSIRHQNLSVPHWNVPGTN